MKIFQTLASVYHKLADTFVQKATLRRRFIDNYKKNYREAGGEVLVQDDQTPSSGTSNTNHKIF